MKFGKQYQRPVAEYFYALAPVLLSLIYTSACTFVTLLIDRDDILCSAWMTLSGVKKQGHPPLSSNTYLY